MEPHWLTIFSVLFTCFMTGIYWYFVLPLSKAKWASIITGFIAAIIVTLLILKTSWIFNPLVILSMWVVPAALVWFNKESFKGLDQRPLVALQIFRFLGLVLFLKCLEGKFHLFLLGQQELGMRL